MSMTTAMTVAPSTALTLPSLAAGSLDSYIQSANRIPMLTEAQELDLARRLRDEGDVDAARQLVMSHLRLVIAVARGYLGYGLPHADLIQEGNIGLMKAVKRYDPERGVRLVSFAIHWVKAEIHEYILRNWRLVKIATTKAQRKLFFNLRSMKQDFTSLGPDEVQHIANTLGVKPEEVMEMETRLSGGDVCIDGSPDEDDERVAPIAWLADQHAEPSQLLEASEVEYLREHGLKAALDSLDERSRAIVARRWLNEDDAATLHELAAEYGVSAERIRQIEARAMQKMRTHLLAAQ